jgi:hypothetical protein
MKETATKRKKGRICGEEKKEKKKWQREKYKMQ